MKKYDVFVSYSSKDISIVEDMVKELENRGVKCWYAPRNVMGRYAKAIVEAIENSKIFLLCLTKNSAVSEHVLNEVEMAYNKRKNSDTNIMIEPIFLEQLDLDNPEFDEIMYYIRRINFISPNGFNGVSIAEEIVKKNSDFLNLNSKKEKKERQSSKYFYNEDEKNRLLVQSQLTKKFDNDVYQKVFSTYDKIDILDVGCGNGSLIIDRISDCKKEYNLIGIDKNEDIIAQANAVFGNDHRHFYSIDIESNNFETQLLDILDEKCIEKFDIINISMVLLHLKSQCRLLRVLRRLLKNNGTLIIKDIDDGLNFAYPDENGIFEHMYELCELDETSGERKMAVKFTLTYIVPVINQFL